MSHTGLSATTVSPFRPSSDPGAPVRCRDTGPTVAILLTGCDALTATIRGFRLLLPRAEILVHGGTPAALCEAEAAGATVLVAPLCTRGALVRRLLAEVEADIYILADGVGPADACLAPMIVAEIDEGERDLVDVSRLCRERPADAGDRLLSRVVDFLFGHGGDMLASDFKAVSRRFARSYRTAGSLRDKASALDLSLHALRLRLPVGRLTALSAGPPTAAPAARTLADRIDLLRLVGRLMVEERPRRVLGLLGMLIVAAGIAVGLPALSFHRWRAVLPFGPAALVSLLLMAAGAGIGAAGAALDALAAARQEVARVGVGIIPRRGERRPLRPW